MTTEQPATTPDTIDRVQVVVILSYRRDGKELATTRRWAAAAGNSSPQKLAGNALDRVSAQITDYITKEDRLGGSPEATGVHTEIQVIYTNVAGNTDRSDVFWHCSEGTANAQELARDSLAAADRAARLQIFERRRVAPTS